MLPQVEYFHPLGLLIVTAVRGKFWSNCAFYDTTMKLGKSTQFDALKKIGSGPHLKNAPKCYF